MRITTALLAAMKCSSWPLLITITPAPVTGKMSTTRRTR